jgi:hypothetical protein
MINEIPEKERPSTKGDKSKTITTKKETSAKPLRGTTRFRKWKGPPQGPPQKRTSGKLSPQKKGQVENHCAERRDPRKGKALRKREQVENNHHQKGTNGKPLRGTTRFRTWKGPPQKQTNGKRRPQKRGQVENHCAEQQESEHGMAHHKKG